MAAGRMVRKKRVLVNKLVREKYVNLCVHVGE